MQNWNQWQLSTGTITTSMPQSPAGYVAPGTDPLVIMQSYMQYYNQPAPSGYTAEQWAAAQQQSWAQWQQWQQQYQQWQSQYGEKYQETMKQLSSQSMNLSGHAPPLPAMQPPPLPKEDTKPPLPPNTVNSYQFTNMPPPHQNNLPLFPAKQSASSTVSRSNDLNCPQNPPLPSTQPPLPPESGKIDESVTTGKRSSSTVSESGSAKKLKIEDEDLTEAEKTFDAQFKQWEEQFNKWKQQNVNHPDKTQYKQYEAKWTSWREKLIERREQMRKKREQQKQIATKSEIEKSKNLPGGDKIMNILSSTENQGLINNLLGIGKTLGLTGKQSATTALQPPPPPPQTTSDSVQSMSGTTHQTASQLSGSSMTSASWTAQQWAGQYNSGLNMQDYSNFQAMSGISAPIEATSNQMALPNFTLPPPNISNSGLNFSQPPPGFSNEGGQHLSNTNMRANLQDRSSFGSSGNNINTYGPNNRGSSEINRLGSNECSNQSNRSVNFEPIEIPMNARINDGISSKGQLNMGSEYLGRDRHIKNLTDRDGNQFRSNNAFGPHTERFKRGDEFYHLNDREGIEGGKYYNRENISYLEHGNSQCNSQNNFTISNNRFGPDRLGLGAGQGIDRYGSMPDRFNITSDRFGSGGDPFIPGNERFGPVGDRFGPTSDRFASSGERFTSSVDRFGSSGDRFGSGNIDRFGPNGDRFGNSERYGLGGDRSISGNDRFGSASDRLLPPRNDRFGPVTDRFGQSNDRCGLGNDRFGSGNDRFTPTLENIPCNDRFNRNNIDRFDIKDMADNRRDSHGNNRNFNRGNQFGPSDELAPELKKLMEKRRAAMDVFKPSFLDSDKSSNVGSLRESFKKIAGDSPFLPRNSADFGSKDFMSPKGLINPSSRGVGLTHFRIFGLDNRSRGPNDFKPHGGPEFKSHSLVNFNPCSNTFDLPDVNSSAFRESTDDSNKEDINRSKVPPTNIKEQNEDQIQIEGNLNSQKIKDFVYSEISDDVVTADVGENNLIEKASKVSEERNESESNVENIEMSQIKNTREEVLNNSGEAQSNTQQDSSVAGEDPLPLEKLPWMDVQFSEVSLPDKDPNNVEHNKNTPSNYITSTEQQNENSNEKKQILNSEEKKESNEFDNNLGKKTEALPFMGENDPKPEDLNMEPPPELPNLGPVSTPLNIENSFTCTQAINESFNTSDSRQHDSNAESYHSKTEFDNLRGSRGVQFRSHVPQSYNPRNSNDERCFALGSRDQNNFPFNNTNSSLARPPNSSDEQFVPLSSSDTRFGSRGSNDAQINFRVSNNRYAGSWRPTDTLSDNQMLVDTQFGSRGPLERPIDFSDSSDRTFNSRRPNEGTLESRGSSDGPFNLRGPNSGQFSHHNTQDRSITEKEFDVRNNKSNDRSFTLRVSASSESPFLPRGLNDQIVTHHTNERSLNNKPPFGNRGFVDTRFKGFDSNISSNANDGCNVGTPSVLAMKAENNKSENLKENYPKKKIEIESMDFGNEGRQQHLNPKQLCDSSKVALPYHVPFSRNSFGDIRSESRLNNTENILSDQDIFNKMKSEKKVTETNTSSTGDFKTGYEDRVTGSDYNKFGTPNIFTKRSVDTRQLQSRLSISKEFCIERQFNYNHGGAVKDKYNEHTPAKIIDYAHTSHLSVQDYMTPTQCFDYGHGSLKPTVPDHELLPQKDFRHWEENEHNLKEYIERMEKYESRMQKHEVKRFMGYSKTICDWKKNDKKSEIEKKDRDEYKERERVYEERSINHKSNKDQDNHGQSDRIRNKERSHDRREGITTDASKEYDNEDIRSKEHTTWQESSSKNIIETKSPHSSISDKQQNASEIPLKTLELAKIPNCTMVDDLLCPPGRQNRPPKIAIILRGPPGSGKSFVAKLIKDKEVEQGGSAPRILSLDDYFLVEKEIESVDDNGKKVTIKEMVYEYEEAMESSYLMSLVKAFKKNITDGFFNFIILDCINEKISDYEDMWSFAKTKGFKVYVCEMEMDVQICLKRNIHNRSEEEINRIVDYFEPTPSYHQKLDVNSMLQEQAIEEVQMEDSQEIQEKSVQLNEESQDSQEDITDNIGISKWERMEAENKLDRLDGLAKKKTESKPQTMEDFLQVPDYYNMEDTSGKKRVRWADLEERKQQEKMRAVGFVVGHTNWDRMMDPTKGGSALTRTKFFSLS